MYKTYSKWMTYLIRWRHHEEEAVAQFLILRTSNLGDLSGSIIFAGHSKLHLKALIVVN